MDVLSPLQELLKTDRGWGNLMHTEDMRLRNIFKCFHFLLIFAGIILDKMGVRFTLFFRFNMFLELPLIITVSAAFIGSAAENAMNHFMNLPLKWWNITPFLMVYPLRLKCRQLGS